MATPQPLGGPSKAGRLLGPSLDKIIKNVAWRKHAGLVAACKSALDKLETISDDPSASSSLFGLSSADADTVVSPLILAVESQSVKVAEPALECAQKLFSHGVVRGEIESRSEAGGGGDGADAVSRLVECICKCDGLGEEVIELSLLRVIVAAVRSPAVMLRGECLVEIVKSLYNMYLGSQIGANQVCAKAVLVQILLIVFARVEADAMDVKVRAISIVDILDLSDKSLNDSNLVQFAQNFINEVMDGSDGEGSGLELITGKEIRVRPVDKAERGHEEPIDSNCSEVVSKIREDGLLLFKSLCKFSMKFSTQESPEDHLLLRGKVLSLELLKIVIDNAGQIWKMNENFLGAIKQYLCLSLLKNSALSVMSIFQLLCTIFLSLLSRFRSGLKGEIGIFFPMLILRVLENVLQPSFLQKLTVLNLLEKILQDPQIMIDIFVNYDCDVDSPNIFERTVNGLHKTAVGVPPGSVTTLSPTQDITFRLESVKCLASIMKSMGTWMDQQLRVGQFSSDDIDIDQPPESPIGGENGFDIDYELQSDINSGISDHTFTLEQRRAYKIEVQKGISLFNRKPYKGIEYLISTKKIGDSPEDVAAFLRKTSGLNEIMIGDYLGDREEFPLKVMHAYVDSVNFEGMSFGEAIRFLLRGFRLPGEAQKIDRIMEKFAEHYCKCNPSSFSRADTAYVLAYSVIMLNTDAHNNMVKNKMSRADFIRNNRGIDDGKDLPEDYLGSLYDQIVKNEIKMKSENFVPQHKKANGINKLLGLENILNLVTWKNAEEKPLGANDLLIKHIQEQFKAKSGKSEPVFYAVTDTTILRFMVEACWAPMMAAFSMTLDQSVDKAATSQCLHGFRCAVHVTSMLCMQTQRDAFVTSVAKFTYLHNAADMKQKNVDAVKAIISIAIEDGNYLDEAWEHILTCLSRFEHLQLLGEGAPPDASFFTVPNSESEETFQKSAAFQSLKKKPNALQNPAVIAVVRGGSYDSTSRGVHLSGLVTSEQINNFLSNLNLLDQIGTFELNHIFVNSQRLNSEAIVAFVKALCKVSRVELQSRTDPRVFSLTKIVEIAHYNMNRIRLVWSRIWNILSEFFVSIGLSENLSVAIFVMDSLRQLAMKFLEREELANYNFQNEFLRPFVIVMMRSTSAEIRELIVRCISQMVLSRVSNVKSGWKSVFMVFTIAAADERKNIVLLAFETMEKIVRDYFPYITETETTTFTDCVKCLTTFTNSKSNTGVSLNAIAFLRFCAVKLAEGGLVCYEKNAECSSLSVEDGDALINKDDHMHFWVPLLSGLSRLTSDPRPAIRKGALEVFFNILKDHGNLFSSFFWISIFKSVIFTIFTDSRFINYQTSEWNDNAESEWHSETQAVAAQCLVDLFVQFFDVVRILLPNVASILVSFIRSPYHGSTSTGVAALLRLTERLNRRLSEKDWEDILQSLRDAALTTLPEFSVITKTMDKIEIADLGQANSDAELYSDHEFINNEEEESNMEIASYSIVRMKGHIAVQLLLVQTVTKLYESNSRFLSSGHTKLLLEIISSIASHSSELGRETVLLQKLQRACSLLEISDLPVVHFENESHQSYLNMLQTVIEDNPSISEEIDVESQVVAICKKILEIYLNCAGNQSMQQVPNDAQTLHWILPLGSAKKEELAARTSLVVLAMRVIGSLERDSFRKYVSCFFPLLVNLIRCEHSSGEVQRMLSEIFRSSIGPLLLNS